MICKVFWEMMFSRYFLGHGKENYSYDLGGIGIYKLRIGQDTKLIFKHAARWCGAYDDDDHHKYQHVDVSTLGSIPKGFNDFKHFATLFYSNLNAYCESTLDPHK